METEETNSSYVCMKKLLNTPVSNIPTPNSIKNNNDIQDNKSETNTTKYNCLRKLLISPVVTHHDTLNLDVQGRNLKLQAEPTTESDRTQKNKRKRHHVQHCAAINCKKNRFENPEMSFFRFPRDEERSKRWKINSRREDISRKSANELFNGTVLCSAHFEDSQFSSARKNRLKKTAVPTLFDVPNPPKSVTLSSKHAPKLRQTPNETSSTIENHFRSTHTHTNSQSKKLMFKSDDVKLLKKKLDCQRKRIKRLQTKPKFRSQKDEVRNIKELARNYFQNNNAYYFFCKQLDLSLSKGNRWSVRDKSFALSLLHASPKAYRILQKLFYLPSVDTLRNTMKKIDIYPGFPKKILSAFKCKVQHMSEAEKLCVLVFDEVSLKTCINYNVEKDYIEGLEDFGEILEKNGDTPAGYASVFMARGLIHSWKQPFGYVLTASTIRSADLLTMVDEALKQLKFIGLTVKAIICDQGPNNMAMLKTKSITPEKPYFSFENDKIFVFYDPPHLLKNIRNNLLRHDFYFSTGIASWKVICDFYAQDEKLQSYKYAPKLTKKHLSLPIFSRQRVCYAVHTLSHSVSKGIGAMSIMGLLPPTAMATSKFCEYFDTLFNIFNSSGAKTSAMYRHPISNESSHMQKLIELQNWLTTLEYGSENRRKTAQSLPCVAGWISNCTALQMLVKETVNVVPGVNYILTSRINQDCLENLFSVIRGKGGQRDDPNPEQFRLALRQVMVEKILLTSPNSNCQDDIDHFLLNLSSGNNVSGKRVQTVDLVTEDPDIEPRYMVNIVRSCEMNELVQLENIIAYVSGYIIKKLQKYLCKECLLPLEESQSTRARHLIFIEQKEFENCSHGGLKKPSSKFVEVIGLFEAIFQTYFSDSMRKKK